MNSSTTRSRQPPQLKSANRKPRDLEELRSTELKRFARLELPIMAHYTPVVGAAAMIVYCGLLAHRVRKDQTIVKPSIRTLSRITGLNITTVQRSLAKLAGEDGSPGVIELAGLTPLIAIHRTDDGKKVAKVANRYELLDANFDAD